MKNRKRIDSGSPLSTFVTAMTKDPNDLDNTSSHMPGPMCS